MLLTKPLSSEGAPQTHARARLERKAQARAYTHTDTDTSYASEMGSRRRKEELRGIALQDAREVLTLLPSLVQKYKY
jgi:hypothetical protein